ncbi:MAG: hypothetical protein WDW38_000955 [Sanguina aurantia]
MLGQTPALLAACTGANDVVDTFLVSHLNNGPLKSLRLVSRGGRAVATPAVSSFTLTLDRQPCRDLSKMVQLLDGVCLRSFGVKVQDKVLARFDGTRAVMYEDQPSMQSQQLALFLSSARAALATVISLQLFLPHPNDDNIFTPPPLSSKEEEEQDRYGLSAFANNTFPAVRHLSVEGTATPAQLRLFAPTLTHFSFRAQHMPLPTIQTLDQLLPLLSRVSISGYTREAATTTGPFNFSKLTGVRTGEMVMLDIGCDTVWASLPPILTSRMCSRTSRPPPAAMASSLQWLEKVTFTRAADVPLGALAGLYRSSPSLKKLSTVIKDMDVNSGLVTGGPLSGAAIGLVAADLVLLNAKHITGVAPVPHSLRFDDCTQLKELFEIVLPLPAFTEVTLDWASVYTTAELLGLLCKVFAGATALELPDLKLLRVMICESVSKESVLPMNSLMDTIGRLVTLEFEPAVVFEAAGPNA